MIKLKNQHKNSFIIDIPPSSQSEALAIYTDIGFTQVVPLLPGVSSPSCHKISFQSLTVYVRLTEYNVVTVGDYVCSTHQKRILH